MSKHTAIKIRHSAWLQFLHFNEFPTAPRYDDSTELRQTPEHLPQGFTEMSREAWAVLPWNPMIGESFTDPKAGNKPTWQSVVERYVQWSVDFNGMDTPGQASEFTIFEKTRRIYNSGHTVDGKLVGIGEGVDHLTAAIYLTQALTTAGEYMYPVVFPLRKNDGEVAALTQSTLRSTMTKITASRLLTENSMHSVLREYRKCQDTFNDTTASYDDRYQAGLDMDEIADQYESLLQKEMAKQIASPLTPTILSGPNGARQFYLEQLESAATGHQKTLKGAITQQAIDNWATCLDMHKSLEKIALECAAATIEISRATTIAEAKTAYDAGVKAIQAVTIVNTPVWTINGKPPQSAYAQRRVRVRADHPEGTTIAGNVAIGAYSIVDSKGSAVTDVEATLHILPNSTAHRIDFERGKDVTGTISVTVHARNICGSSVLTFDLAPPPDKEDTLLPLE